MAENQVCAWCIEYRGVEVPAVGRVEARSLGNRHLSYPACATHLVTEAEEK